MKGPVERFAVIVRCSFKPGSEQFIWRAGRVWGGNSVPSLKNTYRTRAAARRGCIAAERSWEALNAVATIQSVVLEVN